MKLSIDTIMHPADAAAQELAQLDTQIRCIDQIISALSVSAPQSDRLKIAPQPLRGNSLGTTTSPEATGEGGSNALATSLITSATGTEPRTGANIIRLSNGEHVQALVIYVASGEYEASEMDYDAGRPACLGSSARAALELLREWLEAEIEGGGL